MGALKIDCHCSEKQMNDIVNAIGRHLNDSDVNDISDFDELIAGVRVCVDFDIMFGKVSIKEVSVLDNNWELLEEDTVVLKSRLRALISDFNRSNNELISQSADIRRDRSFVTY